ncbi:MAG: thymidylate kinase-like protein [Chloroflexi bacterium]|nr:thymidylate kinase-like protein [Chloroflexota bacterium]
MSKHTRFLYIAGADGTGKSTQAELLVKYLKSCGIQSRRLWLRFPFFFSVPFLAYARWRGYSWHEIHGEVNHGYWDFSRSWLLRNVFPWVLLLDTLLAALVRIYIPLLFGSTFVCERFVLDIMVDLSVAMRDPDFSSRLPGRLFPGLLPAGAHIMVLDLDEETIRSRRPSLIYDHALAPRLEAFRALARHLKLPLIDTHPPKDMVLYDILTSAGLV